MVSGTAPPLLTASVPPPPPGEPPAASPRPALVALAPERYRFQVTIGSDVREKLLLARDMLRPVIASGDDEALLDRALGALLSELARKKFAATEAPRPPHGASSEPESRHIPAGVKRSVWLRDLGRCAFVGSGGRRCDARAFLEFHHVKPWAVGGEAVEGNIELRCRSHNAHEARVYFTHEDVEPGAVREVAAAYVT
jgi:hypothetical protein